MLILTNDDGSRTWIEIIRLLSRVTFIRVREKEDSNKHVSRIHWSKLKIWKIRNVEYLPILFGCEDTIKSKRDFFLLSLVSSKVYHIGTYLDKRKENCKKIRKQIHKLHFFKLQP